MRISTFAMLMLCLVVADAREVYRWIGPDGSMYFSDEPRAGAERITLPDWPPPAPRRYSLPPTPETPDEPVPGFYNNLAVITPESGGTVRDNQGNVAVTLVVEPELDTSAGHRIQLLLDGQPQGAPSDTLEQSLTGVERGSHTVAGQVVNEQGEVLIDSGPVSFYLQHMSPLFHPPNPGTPATGAQQAPRAPMAPRAPRAPHAPFKPAVSPGPKPAPQ